VFYKASIDLPLSGNTPPSEGLLHKAEGTSTNSSPQTPLTAFLLPDNQVDSSSAMADGVANPALQVIVLVSV